MFDLIVRNAAPGRWTVMVTTNLTDWTPLLSTNTSASDWSVTLTRFGRNLRLVLRFEWLTRWPDNTALPVSSQRRDIA